MTILLTKEGLIANLEDWLIQLWMKLLFVGNFMTILSTKEGSLTYVHYK